MIVNIGNDFSFIFFWIHLILHNFFCCKENASFTRFTYHMVKFLLLFVCHSLIFHYSHRVLLYITYIVHVVFVFISQYVVVFVVIFFSSIHLRLPTLSNITILFSLLRRVFTLIFAFSRFFCLCYLLQAAPEWLKNYLKSFSDSYKSDGWYVVDVGIFRFIHIHKIIKQCAAHTKAL